MPDNADLERMCSLIYGQSLAAQGKLIHPATLRRELVPLVIAAKQADALARLADKGVS
jgi:hypothetical protein